VPDAIMLDLRLPVIDGWKVLARLKTHPATKHIPVYAVSGDEKAAEAVAAGAVEFLEKPLSSEQLATAFAAITHRPKAQAVVPDDIFLRRTALIVDDDVRNVFALASVLEAKGMDVVYAENGSEGVRILVENPSVDIVLMDVMMPEMDGYQTIDAIRKMPEFGSLPIIAVTAKAMKGDRERAIESGASSYITKPVDTDELLALMGVWLYPLEDVLLAGQDV
jgi:CheY-like chemotaxis protein